MKFLNKIKSFLPKIKLSFQINEKAATLPQSVGVPLQTFDYIVNELVTIVSDEERLTDFKNYIESPMYAKYKLDMNNPNHAFITGYAFCAAVLIRRQMVQNAAVHKVIEQVTGIPTTTSRVKG